MWGLFGESNFAVLLIEDDVLWGFGRVLNIFEKKLFRRSLGDVMRKAWWSILMKYMAQLM